MSPEVCGIAIVVIIVLAGRWIAVGIAAVGIARSDASTELYRAIASDSRSGVRAALVARHRQLSAQQIRDAEIWLAEQDDES